MNLEIIYLCTVCMGDPASAMTKGATAGILFLLSVISLVLVAIAWTAFQWSRRARQFPNQF